MDLRQYAPPFKLSDHEFAVARAAPAQASARVEILREAGLDDDAIETLVQAKVVRIAHRRLSRQRSVRGADDARLRLLLHPVRLPCASRRRAASQRASYSGSVVAAARRDVVGRHVGRVDAPEQLVADGERRHAEDAARDRLVGVAAQRILHHAGRRSARPRRRCRGRASAPPIRSAGRADARRARRNGRCAARRQATQSHAIARRSSGNGLNGCSGGNLNGMPSLRACQTTKR